VVGAALNGSFYL